MILIDLKKYKSELGDKKFEDLTRSIDGVTSLQSVAYKPALLQSSAEKGQKEILGVVLKGVDKSYDWHFFQSCEMLTFGKDMVPHL